MPAVKLAQISLQVILRKYTYKKNYKDWRVFGLKYIKEKFIKKVLLKEKIIFAIPLLA